MITFPKAPNKYDPVHQAQVQQAIETEDRKNLKADSVITKLKFRDTSTNQIVTVVVTSGAFVIT